MGKTGIPWVPWDSHGNLIPWEFENDQPWDETGNKTHENGNYNMRVGKIQAIATYFCA